MSLFQLCWKLYSPGSAAALARLHGEPEGTCLPVAFPQLCQS